MKLKHKTIIFGLSVLCAGNMYAQGEFQIVAQTLSDADNQPLAVHPVPSERQLLWNETEFYAFFHYGMNTFTGKEWGKGNEAETLYAPTKMPDPEQWLTACKKAGMKGGIAVVKHHDGFCLWPTSTTDHNITKSSGYGPQANIPQLFAEAARKLDMKYGFYVSPWDRNSAFYGKDNYVTDVFLKQCEELALYGDDQFEMWFDGANGGDGYYGGQNTTINIDASYYYDVPNLRDRVHRICKNCVMWGVGGEARWIGNEQGYAGETNWATFNPTTDSNAIRQTGEEDGWQWLPGESDAKATSDGWFWHAGETVLTAERLFQMYLETVGRNSTLILNCPPDKTGSLPAATVKRLEELGEMMAVRLGTDLASAATVIASEVRTAGNARNYREANLIDGDKDTYWATKDGTHSATITLSWEEPQTVRYLQMMEYIRLGHRIQDFKVEYSEDGTSWQELAKNIQTTTVGYKRIVPLNGSTAASYSGSGYRAKMLRITILNAKACPTLSSISVF